MQETSYHYTSLHIIQSLGESESKTGKDLYDYLVKNKKDDSIIELQYHEPFYIDDFYETLDAIYGDAKSNDRLPILHFKLHGGIDDAT